ncbi:hypothetical protein BD410DRAFT_797703 [Rickenella mellea]|uniref:Uncharacterized protein n=1 Tax=Rickenella mellea TaxID=50990 RepID=A0A4R5XDE2_9AGAM|nr:hypothetical protein BD410DRAFT_797703 [Rickenella mellea]
MTLDSDEFRDHFFGLADGTDLVASVNSYGKTPEAQARAAENMAALGQYNTLQGQLRDKVCNVLENEALSGLLANALEDVLDYQAHAMKTPTAIADAWRWTTCGKCNGVLVALVKNHKHRCMHNNCEEQVITAAHFPGLRRLLFLHDILGNATLAPLMTSTPSKFNLTSVSTRQKKKTAIDLGIRIPLRRYGKRSETGKNSPKHLGGCIYSSSSGKNWKPEYYYAITSFFEFPQFWARRLLYYGRAEGKAESAPQLPHAPQRPFHTPRHNTSSFTPTPFESTTSDPQKDRRRTWIDVYKDSYGDSSKARGANIRYATQYHNTFDATQRLPQLNEFTCDRSPSFKTRSKFIFRSGFDDDHSDDHRKRLLGELDKNSTDPITFLPHDFW